MPKPDPRTTPKCSQHFKATAVRLSQFSGVSVQEVAESLYIHPFMLSRWRKEMREGLIVAKGVDLDKEVAAELKELRKVKQAYERLKTEQEIFKKAIAFTSERKGTSSPSLKRTKPSSRRRRCVGCIGKAAAVSTLGGTGRRAGGRWKTRCG